MSGLPTLALSVRQPWAWAIIHGGKDVENRTKYAITLGRMDGRRRIAIHASSGMTRDEYDHARATMLALDVDCPRPDQLVRGAIIGTVETLGAVKESASPWFFGPWALQLGNPEPVEPVACKGELGLFEWRSRARTDLSPLDPLPWMVAWPHSHRPGRSPQAHMEEGPLLL